MSAFAERSRVMRYAIRGALSTSWTVGKITDEEKAMMKKPSRPGAIIGEDVPDELGSVVAGAVAVQN